MEVWVKPPVWPLPWPVWRPDQEEAASGLEPWARGRWWWGRPAAQDGIHELQGGAELTAVALGQVMTAGQTFGKRIAQAVKGVIGEPVQG